MAGPVYVSAGTRVQSAGATTLTPTKPTVAGGTGLLLAVVITKNNATHSTATSGWSLIQQVNSGASFTASIWKAAETAANPVFTWAGSVACGAQVTYYQDVNNGIDTTIGSTTSNSGTTATHSTSSINTTRADSLVVYIDAAAANTALATPSGWTENSDTGSATGATRSTFGSKAVATSGSASGAISVTGASAAWVQFQIELKTTTDAGNNFKVTKETVAAWMDPPEGFAIAKETVAAWLDPGNGFVVTKETIAAWLDYSGVVARRRQFININ